MGVELIYLLYYAWRGFLMSKMNNMVFAWITVFGAITLLAGMPGMVIQVRDKEAENTRVKSIRRYRFEIPRPRFRRSRLLR